MTYKKDSALLVEDINNVMNYTSSEYGKRGKIPRSSQLPYCGLRDFHEYNIFLENNKRKYWFRKDADTSGLMYMGMGTLIHSLLQNIFPKTLKNCFLIGNYNAAECSIDECPHKKNFPTEMGSGGCSTCGKFLPYRELYACSSFSSHVDLVLRIKDTDRVWILDIKTTSGMNMYLQRKTGKVFPHKNHIHQVDSYACNFTPVLRKMGLKLQGTMLLYISRDKPVDYLLMPVEKNYTDRILNRIAKKLDTCSESYSRNNSIMGTDKKKTGRKADLKDFEYLAERKLCKDRKYYDDKVATSWSRCPLEDVCWSKKLKKTVMEKLPC